MTARPAVSGGQGAVVDVLRRIEARIADPKKWTRHTAARDVTGQPVGPHSPRAVCWCLSGALIVETLKSDILKPMFLLGNVSRELYPDETGYIGVNDRKGHDAVLAVVRKAIELASAARPPADDDADGAP